MGIRLLGLRLFVCSFFVVSAIAAPARAAIVSITSTVAADSPDYDLSNVYGTTDWAYWGQTASTLTSPVAPTNTKSGSSLISSITAYGGGGVRGTTSTTALPDYDLAFTNGTSPASGLASNLAGLFNTQIGSSAVGAGVQLTVTAPSAAPFDINVWVTAFSGTAVLTADIGAVSATSPSYTTSGTRSPGNLYTIHVTPDSAGQLITLKYGLTSQTDTNNANASLTAVAIAPQVVPEPSTLALLIGGSSLLGWRVLQRRRARVTN